MKQILTFLVLIIITISCSFRNEQDKKLINNFINEVIIDKNFSKSLINKYIISQNSSNNFSEKDRDEIIIIHSKSLNEQLKSNNNKYKIVLHNKLGNKYKSNLKYDDFNQVYYIIINGKIASHFIIKGNKIVSFFRGLTKNKEKLNPNPWMLY